MLTLALSTTRSFINPLSADNTLKCALSTSRLLTFKSVIVALSIVAFVIVAVFAVSLFTLALSSVKLVIATFVSVALSIVRVPPSYIPILSIAKLLS